MSHKFYKYSTYFIFLLSIASLISLSHLKFDFKLEDFFPKPDQDLSFYEEFKEEFHVAIDENVIFIGIESTSGIFQKEFLLKINQLSNTIEKDPRVTKVYSLTNAKNISNKNGIWHADPLIHFEQPEKYDDDSIYLFKSLEFRDLLVSKNGQSLGIVVFHTDLLNPIQVNELLKNIQAHINELGIEKVHVVCKNRIESVYVDEIKRNAFKYTIISCIVVIASLSFLMSSWSVIVLAMIIIMINILLTLSIISLTGNRLDILSSLIPPVLATICMSNIVHFIMKYDELLRNGIDARTALNNTTKEIGIAAFFASFTTAVGFITLSITNIYPVKLFGLYTGLGVILSFFTSIILLNAFFAESTSKHQIFRSNQKSLGLRFQKFLFRKLIQNRLAFIYGIITLLIVSIYFISKIEINGSFLKEIPKGNPIVADYKFMEEDFYGSKELELVLRSRNSGIGFMNLSVLNKVDQFETFLKDSCHVSYLISPISLFKASNKAFHGGDNNDYQLPQAQQELNDYAQRIRETEYADDFERHMNNSADKIRISGKLPDLSIQKFSLLRMRIENYFNKHFQDSSIDLRITGTGVLLDKMSYSLIDNLIVGLLIAFLVISLIGVYFLRSLRMIIISLVPNLFSLVVIAGLMGCLGIYLKSDTALIFSIAFGIAVDNTIHLLNRIKIERGKGLTMIYAIKKTYLSTGRALWMTTIILLLGFMSLLFSSFSGAFNIGLLVAVSLLFALLFNLSALPLLLIYFYPNIQSSKK